ncbi:MAG TPA: stage II sporulation protein M [Methanocella sp.]|nr:stage II sporulation protein M [Methanocella sp.]
MTFKGPIPGPTDFISYVYHLRWHILAIVMIFIIFTALGYAVALAFPSFTESTISGFKEDVSPLKEMSAIGLMLGIFENNAIKCLMVVLLGLALGIAPIVFIIANGFIIGIIIGATMAKSGIIYVLVGIIPHGIIELPMVIISSAIGLKLGIDVFKKLIRQKANLRRDLKEAIMVFIFWIAPLLLIAAFMETFVTGTLLYLLFQHS